MRSRRERRVDRGGVVRIGGGVHIALAIAYGFAGCLPAQIGSWAPGFNHQIDPAHPSVLNDYLEPFRDPSGATPQFVAPPPPPAVGQQVNPPGDPTKNFYWGQGNTFESPIQPQAFSAIHMALIPKGPHQGKVLVWGSWLPVKLTPNATLSPNGKAWYCQAWAIVDPTQGTFLNYLLPLQEVTAPAAGSTLAPVSDLFCTGHCWSQEGDLVVAGGGTSVLDLATVPPHAVSGVPAGARYLFVFDPAANSQAFPGQPVSASLYGSPSGPHRGHWWRAPFSLQLDRFYPTVVLSQQFSRPGTFLQASEVVVVAGGSQDPDPQNMSRRTYESFAVTGVPGPTGGAPALLPDPDPVASPPARPFTHVVGIGPGEGEMLGWYPRLHLLRNKVLFHSGPQPVAGFTDISTAATAETFLSPGGPIPYWRRAWEGAANPDLTDQNAASTWAHERDDGASLLSCMWDCDVLIRLGGAAEAPYGPTNSAEFLVANGNGAMQWQPLPAPSGREVIPGAGRQYINAIMLPDASILAIGGGQLEPLNYERTTALYRQGVGWVDVGADSPTRRLYHSTAVLLPDGRVLLGGGELSPHQNAPGYSGESDYDIYVPHYLQGNPVRPTFVSMVGTAGDPTPDGTGTALVLERDLIYKIEYDGIGPLDSLSKLVLMAPGSITHHSDMTARYVELPMELLDNENDIALFGLPADGRVPRGYYMLFGLNSAGIPSVATWIKVI